MLRAAQKGRNLGGWIRDKACNEEKAYFGQVPLYVQGWAQKLNHKPETPKKSGPTLGINYEYEFSMGNSS